MHLPEPDRAGFVDVNRTRLRVWEWGDEGAPVIICAHGAYDHGRVWDGFAPRLAELGYRVIAPDLRGHGDSGRLSAGNVWVASALDLGLLARQAGVGRPVGMVGHSMGAGMAMYVAGVWPELVRWVVNLDGLGPPEGAFDAEEDLVESTTKGLAAAERALAAVARPYQSLAEMAARRAAINVRLSADWLDHLVRHAARPVEGGFVWKVDPMFSVGLPGEFDLEYLHAEHEQVECPVLVLTGAEHDTWSELDAEQTADRLSRLRSHRHAVIEGAGHYVHVEQPDAVIAAVKEFLGEVGP